jgi:site-specific recombinase XerD
LGSLVHSFFLDYLAGQKGLRPTTIRSYRDGMRLFLVFVAGDARRAVGQLQLEDLTFERVLAFLRHLEETRHNHIPTRNQRLTALRAWFEYVGRQVPEMLHVCERVAGIPTKRTPLPDTRFMDREEIAALMAGLPEHGRHALRDRALLLFLYNTGARVQEAADLRVEHLTLTPPAHVRLRGKGEKWRNCPLWDETVRLLRSVLDERSATEPTTPVFTSAIGRPLTRFGIYKRVRLHAARIESSTATQQSRRITPHVFRHTAAVHLLEAGVEVNVIRGWLGHANLNTTNRYAEITARMKEEALKTCEPPVALADRGSRKPVWQNDEVLNWLASL